MNGGDVMELRDLECFVVVAEQGNLGRAAEQLRLSQPALSKSLKRLEDALEVRLFRRSANGMELTAEGSLLLSRARELRDSLRNVAREVSDVSRGTPGISMSVSARTPTTNSCSPRSPNCCGLNPASR